MRKVVGDEVLAAIAHALVEKIRRSATIDRMRQETLRRDLRRTVKQLVRKRGHPPDKRD